MGCTAVGNMPDLLFFRLSCFLAWRIGASKQYELIYFLKPNVDTVQIIKVWWHLVYEEQDKQQSLRII